MTSSLLLMFEVENRLNAYGADRTERIEARRVIGNVELNEMSAGVLARALRPFPVPVRTLDDLHLATMDFLRDRRIQIELASYDVRLLQAADAMGFATRQP